MKTFASYNMKGGVGKTTTAVNLAYLSSTRGYRTLIWDLDPQGAATYILGTDPLQKAKLKKNFKDKKIVQSLTENTPYKNISIIPAGFEYRNMDSILDDGKKSKKKLIKILESMSTDYDVFIFDCPPSISNLTETVFAAVDFILMPLAPAVLSQQTYIKVKNHLTEMPESRAELITFFNMVDRRKSNHKLIMTQTKKQFPNAFCATSIPARVDIEKMGMERTPLHIFAPSSDSAKSFYLLWREIEHKSGLE